MLAVERPLVRNTLRVLAVVFLMLLTVASTVLVLLINEDLKTYTTFLETERQVSVDAGLPPFPLGVNPGTKTIVEQPNVESYLSTQFASEYRRTRRITWLDHLYRQVAHLPWYQSLASPSTRILVIFPGERREEVVHNFSRILGWTEAEKDTFAELLTTGLLTVRDGVFYPGKYVVAPDATPKEVASLIAARFDSEVLARYPSDYQRILPIEDVLIIASLIEREASAFSDMRIISGVIWNRLFIDMKLQLDASLQYARGSRSHETKWWPVPVPRDKFIDSPYNTYQNTGLPPGPISNPSVAAIIATLNPMKSDCLFYFHDDEKELHCSTTYEEHKEKIRLEF